MEHTHIPVLLEEAIELLAIKSGSWYIDATFGRGGHTRAILESGGRVIALDHDKEAISYGMRKFVREMEDQRIILARENFEHIESVVRTAGKKIHGILADFGVSSPQIDDPSRGFSFQHDAPLDMRMDDRLGVQAKDLINGLGKKELYEILTRYAQERHAHTIVAAVLDARRKKPIETTTELAHIIEKVVHKEGHLHPATKTFQALRIVVNDELGSIERFLPAALRSLEKGGRLVTISFHEGEDRIVKRFEADAEVAGECRILTKKPVEVSEDEREGNWRSRSAKLRAIEKL